MNEDIKKSKINRFLNDKVMEACVFEVVRDSFLQKKAPRDVYTMAAERIALDLLNEAWRELGKYKQADEVNQAGIKQVGL